ncbi:MAG: SDR family oxidoreductase [Oligoflexia bacterium]|nr:SDR family oxidoreductase [Oligoflexia bacterium]
MSTATIEFEENKENKGKDGPQWGGGRGLRGRTILVTGAMRGIGRGIVLALASEGANVVFNCPKNDTNIEKSFILKREIEALGGKGHPLMFDVSNRQEVNDAIASFLKEGHNISGLVNNAGISVDQLVLRLREEDVDRVIAINLKGVINLSSVLSRHFLKLYGEGQSVSVVNISSVVGLMGNAAQTVYAASKAGVIGFSKSFAKEMAAKGVRCNVVCPGFIDTDMTASLPEKAKVDYLQKVPLQRAGSSIEVANLVCFLLSDLSSYITGEVIKIDGGLYI